jgi:hypothetical protein
MTYWPKPVGPITLEDVHRAFGLAHQWCVKHRARYGVSWWSGGSVSYQCDECDLEKWAAWDAERAIERGRQWASP